MSTDAMRSYILSYYPDASKSWRTRVEYGMPASQIVAIYHSILRREAKKQKQEEEDKKYHQITIFEYLESKEQVG